MADKEDKPKIIDLLKRQAQLGKSSQARRLLRNTGTVARRFTKVKPKPEDSPKK